MTCLLSWVFFCVFSCFQRKEFGCVCASKGTLHWLHCCSTWFLLIFCMYMCNSHTQYRLHFHNILQIFVSQSQNRHYKEAFTDAGYATWPNLHGDIFYGCFPFPCIASLLFVSCQLFTVQLTEKSLHCKCLLKAL